MIEVPPVDLSKALAKMEKEHEKQRSSLILEHRALDLLRYKDLPTPNTITVHAYCADILIVYEAVPTWGDALTLADLFGTLPVAVKREGGFSIVPAIVALKEKDAPRPSLDYFATAFGNTYGGGTYKVEFFATLGALRVRVRCDCQDRAIRVERIMRRGKVVDTRLVDETGQFNRRVKLGGGGPIVPYGYALWREDYALGD